MQEVWSRYDPRGRGYLGTHALRALLMELQAPLGHRTAPEAWMTPVRYECWAVRRAQRGLPFADVLTVLLHHRLGMGVRRWARCRPGARTVACHRLLLIVCEADAAPVRWTGV